MIGLITTPSVSLFKVAMDEDAEDEDDEAAGWGDDDDDLDSAAGSDKEEAGSEEGSGWGSDSDSLDLPDDDLGPDAVGDGSYVPPTLGTSQAMHWTNNSQPGLQIYSNYFPSSDNLNRKYVTSLIRWFFS